MDIENFDLSTNNLVDEGDGYSDGDGYGDGTGYGTGYGFRDGSGYGVGDGYATDGDGHTGCENGDGYSD